MSAINPKNLRSLRRQKGWTLDQLAERSSVDRGTISRIETGKQRGRRQHIIKNLCEALGTVPEVLTGSDILSSSKSEESVFRSQMNVRIGNDVRNALALVANRYRVRPSHILGLAPLLFLWAAEESLRRRQQKIDAFAAQWKLVSDQSGFSHLDHRLTNDEPAWETIRAEERSISNRDIFARELDDEFRPHGYEESEHNPMVQLMKDLASSLNGLAEFLYWSPYWDDPGYSLGMDEARELVGGDEEAADYIVNGNAPLHEMPKEVREAGPSAVARWANERGEADFQRLKEFDLLEGMLDD